MAHFPKCALLHLQTRALQLLANRYLKKQIEFKLPRLKWKYFSMETECYDNRLFS
jgi:hypothetical protein